MGTLEEQKMLLSIFIIASLGVWVFYLYVLCVLHTCLVPMEARGGMGCPEIRDADGYEPLSRC